MILKQSTRNWLRSGIQLKTDRSIHRIVLLALLEKFGGFARTVMNGKLLFLIAITEVDALIVQERKSYLGLMTLLPHTLI